MADKKTVGKVGVAVAGAVAALLIGTQLSTSSTTAATTTTVARSSTTVSVSSTSTSTTTTSVPTAGPSARFFAPSMSWNKTAQELGVNSELTATYAPRMFNYGGAPGWPDLPLAGHSVYDPNSRGQYNLALVDYSDPIWDASQATTTIRTFKSRDAQNIGIPWQGQAIGQTIPWNPNWRVAPGNDGIAAIVNYVTGETWELYRPAGSRTNWDCFDFFGPNGQAGFDVNNPTHTCWGGVNHYYNIFTQSSTIVVRGMGINKLALITRAAEVQSGAIRHALQLTVYNQMFGPACSTNSPSAPGAGSTCGFYLPPATRIEHQSTPLGGTCGANQITATQANRERTIPSGIRFHLNITDTDITNWLNSRGYSGTLRNTARIFAVALRDYGFIGAAETGCVQPLIETDGLINPTTKAQWEAMGIVNSGFDQTNDGWPDFPNGNLLYGLITQARLEVVNPG